MSVSTVDQTRAPRLGDRVQIRNHPGMAGRIIEFHGRLGYKGRELFGVELQYPDHTAYTVALREDLVYLDGDNGPGAPEPLPSATE